MSAILVNGNPDESLSGLDRGLQYGDGVFETLAVHHGVPELWERHAERLEFGCQRLGIPCPDPGVLLAEIARVCAGRSACVAKVMITRGAGGRGYCPPASSTPTRLVCAFDWPTHPEAWIRDGVAIRVCQTRLGCSPSLAGIKHLNRLEQVLARSEWRDDGIAEGVMLDRDGFVVEGTMTNLFWVRGTELCTPPLEGCGVSGIMRQLVIDTASELGIAVRERRTTVEGLLLADEMFLTNSVIRIWPVRALLTRRWIPGPITQWLAGAVARALER